ncbi:MAG TPA: DEAD/DEAH box helicase [Bacteroides sp.]|nr:DEAD/DEAH box helicase [Bacteroides sp.]
MEFKDFGFDPTLLEGIESMGFKTPTPIQEQAIPAILQGRDLMGSAQTGTGKTAAFLLPVIHRIITSEKVNRTRALVIVPTRELALQIDQHMEGFSYFTPVSSIAVYGGGDGNLFTREKNALIQGTEVVICTPGRMIAHLNNDYVDFGGLETLILDEADRMLDMGFYDDIIRIIRHLPEKRQNLMFAATMPAEIRELANNVLRDPVEVNIALAKPADNVLQAAYVVYDRQKLPLTVHLLKDRGLQSVIVFCATKATAKVLGRQLKNEGLVAQDIHSDLEQSERKEIMRQFRNRRINIMVATDLLSRGIDVEDIDLIINYDVPREGEDYIHRIGRTARAKSEGVAITLIGEKEQAPFSRIEKLLGSPVIKVMAPAELGETPPYDPGKRRGRRPGSSQGRGRGKDQGQGRQGQGAGRGNSGRKSKERSPR